MRWQIIRIGGLTLFPESEDPIAVVPRYPQEMVPGPTREPKSMDAQTPYVKLCGVCR